MPSLAVRPSQRVAYRYSIACFAFFGLQGLVASLGALDLAIPDLPAPISFAAGRSIHLNLAILWPVLGSLGAAYFFFCQEARTDLASPRLARLGFWLFLLVFAGNLFFLALGRTEGREYLEALRPFKYGIATATLITLYNLTVTYFRPGVPRYNPVLAAILAGSTSLIIFYTPAIFSYSHPTVDETVRFWVVHIWEESSLELLAAGFTASILLAVFPERRPRLLTILYVDLALISATTLFSTGHHYYWIGLPALWQWIGSLFSAAQVIPLLLLFQTAYLSLQGGRRWKALPAADKISLAFLASSIFYHVFGAGLLGLIMSVPQWNRYSHGTYITSAHAHLALFGAMGFLVLGAAYYILTREMVPTVSELRRSALALLALNTGLLVMAGSLLAAGFLQSYLWRVAGMNFVQVNSIIQPYLTLRAGGGLLFAGGGLLLAWSVAALAWRHRQLALS